MTSTAYEAGHYVQSLDLGADPFVADVESDYFYVGAQRRELLEQLIHFSRFGKQTVVLLGATGSGSSTLLDQALNELEELADFCCLDGEQISSPEQLIEQLNQQLQLQLPAPFNIEQLLQALRDIVYIDGKPEAVVIAIDQAHFMSLQSYQLLLTLVNTDNDMLRLVLVGEYQVEPLLSLAGFDKPQLKLLELKPLSLEECGQYLQGLLQSVGYAGEMPLSRDQMAVLYQQSAGNLLEINQLAPSLLSPMAEDQSVGSAKLPLAHLAAVAVLAISVLFAWLYLGKDEAAPLVASSTAIEPQPVVRRTEVEISLPPAKVALAEQITKADRQQPADEETAVIRDGASEKAAEKLAKSSTAASWSSNAVARTAPGAVEVAAQSVSGETGIPKFAALPIKSTAPKLTTPKKLAATLPTTSVPKVNIPKPAAASNSAMPPREQRLLRYSESAYLLQLLGTVDESRTREFVKGYVGKLPVTYFETRLNGKPWFVAVTGPYVDKAAANVGVKVLPAALQKQQPWARSVASVQQDIRKNRQ
ncbi:MAG: DamX protein [Oceanicoccus sp.]|jgi:DamX protein